MNETQFILKSILDGLDELLASHMGEHYHAVGNYLLMPMEGTMNILTIYRHITRYILLDEEPELDEGEDLVWKDLKPYLERFKKIK